MIQVKRSILLSSLLFSIQVGDTMAGVMRSLRDIDNTYYIQKNTDGRFKR
jgi:hypothetical protein